MIRITIELLPANGYERRTLDVIDIANVEGTVWDGSGQNIYEATNGKGRSIRVAHNRGHWIENTYRLLGSVFRKLASGA